MIILEGVVLGALLTTASFFFVLTIVAYLRSGVKPLLLTQAALGLHVAFTLAVLLAVILYRAAGNPATAWLVAADAFALVMILFHALAGGEPRGGSA